MSWERPEFDPLDAWRSEHPPEWHRARLDRMVRSLWRVFFVVVFLLVVVPLLELL